MRSAPAIGAHASTKRIEAEFHAGWIALRFLNDPARAARISRRLAELAETPISMARAAYWQGRAAENSSARRERRPRRFYERGGPPADHLLRPAGAGATRPDHLRPARTRPTRRATSARGHHGRLDIRGSTPLGEAATRTRPAARLDAAPRPEGSARESQALGDVAHRRRTPQRLLTIGKVATQRGLPLDATAFPTFGIPA